MEAPQDQDFGELAVRLAAFALRVFAEFGIGGQGATIAGVGLSAEDFVWKVLSEYAEGKLQHQQGRGNFFSLLATALRNDIVDALRKAAHSREEIRPSLPRGRFSELEPPGLDELPGDVDFSAALDQEDYLKRVRASVADEPELLEMVRIILDLNLYKPRDIAAALGVSAAEVQNRKKRLRRRFLESSLVQRVIP